MLVLDRLSLQVHNFAGSFFYLLYIYVSSTRWNQFVPRKINIFFWRARLDRLPMKFNLSKKGLEISSIICPVCDLQVECMEHLFFKCEIAARTWNVISRWIGLILPEWDSVSDTWNWLDIVAILRYKKQALESIFMVTCWSIWKNRNMVVFNEGNINKKPIFYLIVDKSYDWFVSRNRKSKILGLIGYKTQF